VSRGTEGQRDRGTKGVGVAPDREGKSGLPDQRLLATVRGFMDPEEGTRLYELALEAGRRGPCLEIGGFCGKSTLYLGSGCRDAGGILYSIDHHRGSEEHQPGEEYFDPALWDPRLGRVNSFTEFIRTVERGGLTDTVVPVVSASAAAARFWSTPLSLVLIDGGHSYAAAFADYNGWAGHLMPGGFLAIHDIFADPGDGGQAPRQIYKLAAGSGLFRRLPMTGTLGVLQRRAPGETPDGP
jgi:MMP 1-O-methyltransferase